MSSVVSNVMATIPMPASLESRLLYRLLAVAYRAEGSRLLADELTNVREMTMLPVVVCGVTWGHEQAAH
jgi:hypothetical protein